MIGNMKEATRGRWRGILSSIIGQSFFTGKHGPCPLCGGTDRFRFVDKNGCGSYYCNGCGAGTAIELICLHQSIKAHEAWTLVEKVLPTATYSEPKKGPDYSGLITKLVKESVPVTPGSAVERYLKSRLHEILEHTQKPLTIPECIRQVRYTDYSDAKRITYDAMMCMVEKNGKLAGLHLTLLEDGKKANIPSPRRLLKVSPDSLSGAAIKLFPPVAGDMVLQVAEGVETAFSAFLLFDFATWATVSSALMVQVEIPKEITHLVIAGDNDLGFGGQAAAYTLAHTQAVKGKKVKVRIPKNPGTDWNDVFKNK